MQAYNRFDATDGKEELREELGGDEAPNARQVPVLPPLGHG